MKTRHADGERTLAVFFDFENIGIGLNHRRDRFEIVKVVVNGDRVFVDAVAHGRGKGSGLELSQGFNQVLTIRDGKIAVFEIFIDRSTAKRAAGLGG